MAKLVGVFNTSHTPFCYMPPENWNYIRANRTLRDDVPMDDEESNHAKSTASRRLRQAAHKDGGREAGRHRRGR